MCGAECEQENAKRHNASVHYGGYRWKNKIGKKRKSLMMWLSLVQAMRFFFLQMLHTSSVNLLFLPESRDAGVSLLANVAV